MAVVLPVVAAFAGASAGVAALGVATTALGTFAAYATIAGSVLTGIGAVTGSKDLMKIGGIIGIAGGIGSFASSAGGAAAEAGVIDAAGGEEAAGLSEFAGSGGSQLAEAAGAVPGAAATPALDSAGSLAERAQAMSDTSGVMGAPAQAGDVASFQPGMEASKNAAEAGATPTVAAPNAAVPDAVRSAASKITMPEMQSFWDKLKGAGEWINKNPALLKVGGDVLASMYGPQAEQLDYQKSLYERARQNLNSPVKLEYKGGKP